MTGTRLALDEIRGPLSTLMEKLSSGKGDEWLIALNKFLRKENPWDNLPMLYPNTLVGHYTWKQRIDTCGFDEIDPDIWANIDRFYSFGGEDVSLVSVILYTFGKRISSRDVELYRKSEGTTMLSSARFLALCKAYPDLQRSHPLVCTDVICTDRDGKERVLYANANGSRRVLQLHFFEVAHDWIKSCCFPSVSSRGPFSG